MRLFPLVILLALVRVATTAEQTVIPLTPHEEQRVEPVAPAPEQRVDAVDAAQVQQVAPATPPTATQKTLSTVGKVTVGILAFGVGVGTTLAMLLFL